jgi:hypothetical protein
MREHQPDFEVIVDTAPPRTVHHHPPSVGNPLAIASMVVGILAALACWVPVLGLVSVPTSIVALILGIPGVALALPKGRTGFAPAMMGIILAIGSIWVARSQAERVSRAIDQFRRDVIRSAGPEDAGPSAVPRIDP